MLIDLCRAARTSPAASKRRAGPLVVAGLSVLALLLMAAAAARAAEPPNDPLVPGLYCREAFAPLGLVDSVRATEGRQVTVQEHPALSDRLGEAASPTADGQPRPPVATELCIAVLRTAPQTLTLLFDRSPQRRSPEVPRDQLLSPADPTLDLVRLSTLRTGPDGGGPDALGQPGDRRARFVAVDPHRLRLQLPEVRARQSLDVVPPARQPTADERVACAALGVCRGPGFPQTISHEWLIAYHDDFVWRRTLPYTTVLAAPRDLLLNGPADAPAEARAVPSGTLLLLGSGAQPWVPAAMFDAKARLVEGQLARHDTVRGEWVAQRFQTSRHRFRAAVLPVDESSLQTTAVEVLDSATGKVLQWLGGIDSEGWGKDPSTVLRGVDANFDGWPDLQLIQQAGGAGPNATWNIFLFEPASGRYVWNEALSQLPQLSIDAVHRRIESASRNSCCSHTRSTWAFQRGELVLMAEVDESMALDDSDVVVITRSRRVGKRWVTQVRRVRTPAAP